MDADSVRVGTTLGRYELLARIARGGMAEVWAARLKGSRGFQRLVAIKTILPSLSDDPRFEQMFLDEAALASRIHHPHVVEIHDLGEQRDILYLVMEWIEGDTVAALLRRAAGPVPVGIASRLVMQACAGLHAAHELRDDEGLPLDLVHRDVSPQNLLVTREGALKVVDFGIAKALGRLAGETAVGNIKGKVPYMAPEQARGDRIDRRADVFALGTVYYCLVAGEHPFRSDDDGGTLRNVIAAAPRRPREVAPSLPPEIDEVIMTALAKDPADRFPSMAAFETRIAEAMTRLQITVNDQAVKELMRAKLGDREAERRTWLHGAMREADRNAASTPPGPPSGEVTSVTAGTREDSSVSVGSDVKRGQAPPTRSAIRVVARVVGLAVAVASVATVTGVWMARHGQDDPPAPAVVSAAETTLPEPSPERSDAPSPTTLEAPPPSPPSAIVSAAVPPGPSATHQGPSVSRWTALPTAAPSVSGASAAPLAKPPTTTPANAATASPSAPFRLPGINE